MQTNKMRTVARPWTLSSRPPRRSAGRGTASRSGFVLAGRRADAVEDASRTVGSAGLAHAAAVEDEQVRKERALPLGHHPEEAPLYLLRVPLFGETEPARHASDRKSV